MKYILLSFLLAFIPISVFSQFSVSGNSIEVRGEGSVDKIYLLNALFGNSLTYTASDAASVRFYKYSVNVADRIDITDEVERFGDTYTINNLEDNKGYVAEVSGASSPDVIWIFDYSMHMASIESIWTIEEEDKCEALKIGVNDQESLKYHDYSNGLSRDLWREYILKYASLKWNPDNLKFEKENKELTRTDVYKSFLIDKKSDLPLENTEFVLQDNYAVRLGLTPPEAKTDYIAVAIEGYIDVKIINENEEEEDFIVGSDGLSAPLKLKLTAYVNKPTADYYTWYIYNTKDLVNYIDSYREESITYTFKQSGTFKVVLEYASAGSACVATAELEDFRIRESSLLIPNFFTPDGSPGVNDEFKVKYKSIVKFKCTIFNRWGNKLFQWTDPEQGWDGKYKGKYVNPGVYFYVVDAEGSDGVKYKKGGDINILRSK